MTERTANGVAPVPPSSLLSGRLTMIGRGFGVTIETLTGDTSLVPLQQVHVTGPVRQLPAAESDALFAERPAAARATTAASPQP